MSYFSNRDVSISGYHREIQILKPKHYVGPWTQSTFEPDINRRLFIISTSRDISLNDPAVAYSDTCISGHVGVLNTQSSLRDPHLQLRSDLLIPDCI